jgi:hypothetical protein
MKKSIVLVLLLSLFSCSDRPIYDHNNIQEVLNSCNGELIVISKGFNSGNYEAYRYGVVFKCCLDSSFRSYVGMNYEFSVGDTIK